MNPLLTSRTFQATADAAASAHSHAEFLLSSVRHMAGLLGATRCGVMLEQDGRLRCGAAIGLPDDYLAAIDDVPVSAALGSCGRAASTGETCITADIELDPSWAPYLPLTRAAGLRSCWSMPLKLECGRVLGTFALYRDRTGAPSVQDLRLAEAYAAMVALGLESIDRQRRVAAGAAALVGVLTTALDARDEYTASHSQATAALATEVATHIGLAGEELETVTRTALLHDIGKIGIPSAILQQPAPLTAEDWAIVREHPVIGERILAATPELAAVARSVRHEHERWDGTGYPDGLAGEHIPLASRIVFACDAYHAMTSDRPYRPAIGAEIARAELRECAGTQFDPRVIAVLLERLGDAAPVAPRSPRENCDQALTDALGTAARELGADDVFVFRHVSHDVYSHLAGYGRGQGWAGNIELHSPEERHVPAAVAAGRPLRLDFPEPQRIAGPYYARQALIVPLGDATVVVFGALRATLADPPPARAHILAERVAALVDDVSPAKRLADELEVLDAVRAITTVSAEDVERTLSIVADRAAAALSCEFGAIVLLASYDQASTCGFASRGWNPEPDVLAPALLELSARAADGPVLYQAMAEVEAPPPGFTRADGVSSLFALPIGAPAVAMLLVAHAAPLPRGFTALCQRVARTASEAAELVIRRAVAQARLTAENSALAARVHVDAVTGVASRAAWEDALGAEQLRFSRSGAAVTVVIVDVDGLKRVNDRHGHAAGDELLRTVADLLVSETRATDLVARLGGDEFGVLLRYADAEQGAAWVQKLAYGAAAAIGPGGVAPSFSVGIASALPGLTLADAVARADRAMYAQKAAGHTD